MRIQHLTVTGFGPFKGTEDINFDAFSGEGLFLIAGRTGAGKSSILDAITFALYGQIPRYPDKAVDKVRSDYLDPAEPSEVVLEFRVGEDQYRVRRTPRWERPKARGEGFTLQKANAEFARWTGSEWQVETTKADEVAVRVIEVVRLDASQFRQVILLAQGEFQKFLVAGSEERTRLLRTLFDSRRFDDYANRLQDRASGLRDSLKVSQTTIDTQLGTLAETLGISKPAELDALNQVAVREWLDEVSVQARAELEQAQTAEKQASEQHDQAEQAYRAALAVAEKQLRLGQARTEAAALEEQEPLIAEHRGRLTSAERANQVHLFAARAQQATAGLGAAADRLTQAQQRVEALGLEVEESPSRLQQMVDELNQRIGFVEPRVSDEERLEEISGQLGSTQEALQHSDAEHQARLEQREANQIAMGELRKQISKLREGGVRKPKLEAAKEQAQVKLSAALKAADARLQLGDAKAKAAVNEQELRQATQSLSRLLAAQLEGYASVLASELIPEEPCPVCGSTQHPAPATPTGEPVREEDIQAATQAREVAAAANQGSGRLVSGLESELKLLQAQAGGQDPTALQSELQELQVGIDVVESQLAELAAKESELRTLESAVGELEALIAGHTAEREELQRRMTQLQTQHQQLGKDLQQARGEFDSVAERLLQLRTQLTAQSGLLTQMRGVQQAQAEATRTGEELKEALLENQFESAGQADQARLSPAQTKELRDAVRNHGERLAVVQAALQDPELQDLPDDVVETEALQQVFQAARQASRQAAELASGLRERQQIANSSSGKITANLTVIAELIERHRMVDSLASAVRGLSPNTKQMRLETFVLAAELEEIVIAANKRLEEMTSGRYQLRHFDEPAARGKSGLGLRVLDSYNGEERSPESLSGGEKFQASLALALGLAEVVTNRAGGIRLDTLFIDEGFGSLDADTLGTTMATLDSLKAGGRVVGVISHVQQMQETIATQLRVRATEQGWSTIES